MFSGIQISGNINVSLMCDGIRSSQTNILSQVENDILKIWPGKRLVKEKIETDETDTKPKYASVIFDENGKALHYIEDVYPGEDFDIEEMREGDPFYVEILNPIEQIKVFGNSELIMYSSGKKHLSKNLKVLVTNCGSLRFPRKLHLNSLHMIVSETGRADGNGTVSDELVVEATQPHRVINFFKN